jgi:SP family general alpha glucoside:H+ symporter-like MFS transporter
MLAVGEFLCGLPWGCFQTLSTTYAVEVVPTVLRPILTSFVCQCWGWGIFISSGVARGALELPGDLAWRLPFGLQWIWPVPLFICFLWVPESPWFLVRQGRIEQARVSLRRLRRKGDEQETEHAITRTLASLVHTIALENRETAGASYVECFKGINRRRTEIVRCG